MAPLPLTYIWHLADCFSMFDVCASVGSKCGSAGTAARTLANIADVLGAMSRGNGGLRSGPACNRQWESAFKLLEVSLVNFASSFPV